MPAFRLRPPAALLGLGAVLCAALPAPPARAGSAAAQALLGATTVSDVAERVAPSVVSITTEVGRAGRPSGFGAPRGPRRGPQEFFFGPQAPLEPQERRGTGVASGVIVSADGYVVTNNHVVKDATRVRARLSDGRELVAKVVGTDEPSDLALLKVDAAGLPFLEYGDSAGLRLGELVLALGNPFGVGETVTMGIVSAKGRSNVGIVDYEDFIQTDAAINPGNSGGALVDLQGRLVGINTAILSQSGGAAGIGFAVPSAMVRPILDQIRAKGSVTRGWLGVAIQDLTPELAEAMKLDGQRARGVLVSDVMEGGPAAKGGLESGDVVLRVDGRPVASASALRNTIAMLSPGARAQLTVLRGGDERELTVTLAKKETRGARPDGEAPGETGPLSGLDLRDLDGALRRQLELPPKVSGVGVMGVEPESPAARAGLREGDVITAVERRPIASTRDLPKLRADREVLLRVWRAGSFLFMVVAPKG